MNGTKTCPLCGTQRWNLDGKIVAEMDDIYSVRINGFVIKEIVNAIRFAESRGWKAGKV